ncbi:MAG TPA: PilN domain-containing protein [Armatimonadota bacterium]
MLLINLIAARRAERRKLEFIRGVLARCMFAVGALTVMGVVFMTFSIQTTRSRIRDVDAQTAMLQTTVAKVEQLQADMAAVQPRVATLLAAQNSTNRWRAVLQEVGASLPAKAWLTSFATQAQPADSFIVTGQTISQKSVGEAMLHLNGKPYVQSVELHYTQASSKDKLVNFEMAGALVPLEGATDGK